MTKKFALKTEGASEELIPRHLRNRLEVCTEKVHLRYFFSSLNVCFKVANILFFVNYKTNRKNPIVFRLFSNFHVKNPLVLSLVFFRAKTFMWESFLLFFFKPNPLLQTCSPKATKIDVLL